MLTYTHIHTHVHTHTNIPFRNVDIAARQVEDDGGTASLMHGCTTTQKVNGYIGKYIYIFKVRCWIHNDPPPVSENESPNA